MRDRPAVNGNSPSDWKLKLRYGKLETPYKHFITVSDGRFEEPCSDFDCPAGPAVMTMKVWVSDQGEAFDMTYTFGDQIGFDVSGRIELYETAPEEPPRENPFGYGMIFVPYDSDA